MPRPPPDTVLAFDTATEQLALAVAAAGARWCEDLPGGAAASAALLPALQALLARAGRTMEQVAVVAFGRGPGAFTGLRTSAAVAQGLALGLNRPALPIDSLLIVAEQARQQAAPQAAPFEIGVVMDARMGELYAGRYAFAAGAWVQRQAPGLWAPALLAEAWGEAPPAATAGSGLASQASVAADPAALAALERACPAATRIAIGPEGRAAALLALALQAWNEGGGVDAAEALPLYLRDKVALTTAERAAARTAA